MPAGVGPEVVAAVLEAYPVPRSLFAAYQATMATVRTLSHRPQTRGGWAPAGDSRVATRRLGMID